MENFGRAVRVTFDGRLVAENLHDNGLRIAFRAFRTRQMQPQRFSVTIWGLGKLKEAEIVTSYRQAAKAASLAAAQGASITIGRVGIEVGRWGATKATTRLAKLIEGDLTELQIVGEKPDQALQFSGADGFNAWRNDFISESLAGVPVALLEKVIATAMESTFDNVQAKKAFTDSLTDMAIKGAMSGGFVAHGRRNEIAKKVAESMKLMAVKREGQGVLLRFDGVDLTLQSVVVSDKTGLLGTPRVSASGKVNFETLLDDKLMPGRQVLLHDGPSVTAYRVDEVEHDGDTDASGGWTSSVVAWVAGEAVKF